MVVSDLHVQYGTQPRPVSAVRGVSFGLHRGEALGLVGESGSGKSTVAMSILRLLDANASVRGQVSFAGTDLLSLDQKGLRKFRGGRLGAVFQDPLTNLTPSHRVGDLLTETLMSHRLLDRRGARRRSVELLEQVGLDHPEQRARQYPHQMSGGMRQRVGIALAICCNPEVLVLDEPTTALDVTVQAQILALLSKLRADLGLSMLFITHDLASVSHFCDRVMVMYAGEIVETSPTQALFRAPAHPYTKGLLASVPTIAESGRKHLASIAGSPPGAGADLTGCAFRERCPFSAPRCAEPQVLHETGEETSVRCCKVDQLAGLPWPRAMTGPQQRAEVAAGNTRLLELTSLHKDYRLGGQGSEMRLFRTRTEQPRPDSSVRTIKALDGVSLSIMAGETLALVGESGSGKSTLGRCIVRLSDPTSGQITLEGKDPLRMRGRQLREYLRNVQVVFQDPESSLNPHKSVAQIVARPIQLYGLAKRKDVSDRVRQLLRDVNLTEEHATRYPRELSGGERQRVGIARALAAEPRILICDEPVSALDVSVRASVLNLLLSLQDEHGLSYLFISHDLGVVRQLADRVAVMYQGRIVECDATRQIFEDPRHDYTKKLLKAVPVIPDGVESIEDPERGRKE